MAFRPWNNLGLKLFALLAALLLWALVMGEQGVERMVSARVEFSDLPRDLVLVARSNGTLLLRVRGPKRLLGGLAVDEVGVSLAAREVREGAFVVSLAPADVLGLPRGVEVVEISPRSLRLQAEVIVRRDVEIRPRIEGTPGPGFVVRRVRLDPGAVQIAGPRSEVGRIVRAYTLPVSVEGRTASFSARAALEPMGQQVQFVNGMPIHVSVDIGPGQSGEGRDDRGPRPAG